jgi:hypothetical protein
MWSRIWRLPQAIAWDAGGAFDEAIARYVWLAVKCEGGSSAALLAELRQTEDRIGMHPLAMAKLRWVITEDEALEAAEPNVLSIRNRLKGG